MGLTLRIFLSTCLIVTSVPLTSWAEPPLSDKVVNHILMQMVLDQTVIVLGRVHSLSDFEGLASERLNDRDRKTVHTRMRALKAVPRFERLNRGLAIVDGKERHTIVSEDISGHHFLIDGRILWTYDPNNSLTVQLEVLQRALSQPQASLMDLLLPKAEALFPPLVLGFIIGIATGLVVTQFQKLLDNVVYPALQEWMCNDKFANTYLGENVCASYVEWKKKKRPGMSTAAPVPATVTAQDVEAVKRKIGVEQAGTPCRPPGKSDQVFIMKNVRRTIHYGPDNKPTGMLEEMLNPNGQAIQGAKAVYTFDSSGKLLTFDGGKKVLSRKPEDSDKMTKEELKQMDDLDLLICDVSRMVETCNGLALQASEAGALQSATVAVGQLKPSPYGELPHPDFSKTPSQR